MPRDSKKSLVLLWTKCSRSWIVLSSPEEETNPLQLDWRYSITSACVRSLPRQWAEATSVNSGAKALINWHMLMGPAASSIIFKVFLANTASSFAWCMILSSINSYSATRLDGGLYNNCSNIALVSAWARRSTAAVVHIKLPGVSHKVFDSENMATRK